MDINFRQFQIDPPHSVFKNINLYLTHTNLEKKCRNISAMTFLMHSINRRLWSLLMKGRTSALDKINSLLIYFFSRSMRLLCFVWMKDQLLQEMWAIQRVMVQMATEFSLVSYVPKQHAQWLPVCIVTVQTWFCFFHISASSPNVSPLRL